MIEMNNTYNEKTHTSIKQLFNKFSPKSPAFFGIKINIHTVKNLIRNYLNIDCSMRLNFIISKKSNYIL